jgi:flagellar hook-associated protein 2
MVAVTGIGSGLDIEGIVSQLIAAEREPVESRLLRRETRLTSQLSAVGTLQGALSNLQSRIETLASAGTFTQRTASSSNRDAVTATARSDASPGSLRVQVDGLADAQSLASGVFGSLTDTVGEGTLTLRFGTVNVTTPEGAPQTFDGFAVNAERPSATITIDSSNNTLQGVRDAINAADAGVSAAIVDDGSGFRLLLSSTQTGAANAVEIQVDDTGDGNDADASGLSRLAFNETANNLEQTAAARDAAFSINGLSLSSASNRVESVIDGVDLTLRETTETAATVTVSNNEGAVRSAIEGFVEAFNNFARVSGNLTAYDAEAGTAGPLQGDITARSITTRIRQAISGSADGFDGAFSSLTELGIRTQADGSLSVDEGTFNRALSDNFDSIAGVFARVGQADDSNIRFRSSSEATAVGSFAVDITQLATRGSLQGEAIAVPTALAPLVIDASNDTLEISVNGVASGPVALSQGSYDSGAALAAELQSRINGSSALSDGGISVRVDFTADGRLDITSTRFGSDSRVEITAIDSATTATLGLAAGSGTAGRDVAGSIGGVTATGSGQTLRGAAGSETEGLVIDVTGGVTGARGSVDVSSGVAVALNGILEGFLGNDGLLALRSDGIQGGVDRIEAEREALNTRLEALEARFRSQFNALDTLLANLQSTSDFLSQQLASIPVPGQDN